jgi:site-specific recombinase XerD
MDIVTNFKQHLQTEKKPPSPVTIKNYLSDVRKFVLWYSEQFQRPFISEEFTPEVVSKYQTYIQSGMNSFLPTALSAKRYISSLRRFGSFLEHSGAINKNPFSLEKSHKFVSDPFFLKEFKNFLYSEHAKKLTIKNYSSDLKQFIDWLEQVIPASNEEENENRPSTLLTSIDNFTIEQYKTRLLNEAKLSPISINRKLSSIRRYLKWLNEKGILSTTVSYPEETVAPQVEEPVISSHVPELPLTALQGLAEEKENEKRGTYSHFAPIRLAQKTTKIISLGADLLFFSPIAHVTEAIQYSLWKKSKRTIFAPVTTILESSSYIPKGISIKTIIPKASSIIPPRTANLSSVITKINSLGTQSSPETVHNFTKALYAPLKISTKHMTWQQKLIHTLHYSRPSWYKKYHEFAFVHYFHIGIMIMTTVIAGAALYRTWYGTPTNTNQAVLSAQDTAPPRTLSFQGRLLDNANSPITAETPLRFALYNSPTASGPAMLWQEEQNIKPDQNGYFTATLGNNVRLTQQIFTNNPSLYIGLTVGSNPELDPRQQIPTSQYAANSQSVEGLKPITDSPTLAQNVLLALDSSGNLTIGGNASHTFQATGGQFTISGQAMLLTTNTGSNGNVKIAPDGSGIIDLEKPIQNISNYTGPSGVTGSVEVDDVLSVFATSSSQSALVVNQNGSGDIISGKSNGIDKFRLDKMGNEYISGNLILNGDTIGTNSTSFDIGGSNVKTLSLGDSATVLTLGASSGITAINNNLNVQGTTTFTGAVTANAGITIPTGQKLTFADFTNGAIPFANATGQIVQDAGNFSWDDTSRAFNVVGSLCIQSGSATCGTTPGTIYATNTTVQSADLAENYVSSQTLQPGDVVVMEGQNNNMAIIKSTSPYQKGLIGIISTNPGITLNSGAKADPTHPNIYPLALQGRVPVKVSTLNGSIQAGDDLTSSSIPGIAMKATGSGQVIGKALESYTNSNPNAVGQIMVFVNLSYQTTATTITDNGNLAAATESAMLASPSAQVDQQTILQALESIPSAIPVVALEAKSITTESLKVTTDTIMIGTQTLKQYITALVEQLVDEALHRKLKQPQTIVQIINPVASNSALATAQIPSLSPTPTEAPKASNSASLQTVNSQPASPSAIAIYNIYNSIASVSASASPSATPTPTIQETTASNSAIQNDSNSPFDNQMPDDQNQEIQNIDSQSTANNQYEPVASLSAQLGSVPNLQASFATFNQGLISLGPTSLTDVGVSGTISINNNLKITADSINTIGTDLNIQPLRQGKVTFMGGLVTIDTNGNLQVGGDATFAHNVSVNGELAAGIIAPIPNKDLIISLDNKSKTESSSLFVTNATGSSVLKVNQSGDLTSSGAAQFNTVSSNGFSIIRGAQADTSMTQTVAQGSAGTGLISAYETERTILTPYVTAHSLIYITPTSNTGNVTPYLARQTVENPQAGIQGSFTVEIPASITKDVGFNWWIVN